MRLLIALVVLSASVLGATIQGNIYDYSLEPMTDVVVTVDSSPRQQIIAKDGSYSFELPDGQYTITANFVENGLLRYSTSESIEVSGDGVYTLDILMFPALDDEAGLADFEIGLDEEESRFPRYFWALLIAVFAAGLLWYFKRKKSEPEADETYEKVLAIIRKKRRITQKDIRNAVPMSEAKISLVISELEDKGLIRKIKKGRGNIIILN